jgi:hypothetical protein
MMSFIKQLGIGIASPIPDGHAQVVFDAGGQGTFVTPNPVRPVLSDDKKLIELHWTIATHPLHANSEFEVIFGNIVPCHMKDEYLEGLTSKPEDGGKRWKWTWPVTAELLASEEEVILFYDLFFLYGPKSTGSAGRPRNTQTVSLRQVMSADPTLILPPKEPPPA